MRIIPIVLLSFAVVSCGGISKKDLDQTEAKFDAKLAQATAEMDRKITAIDTKYANVLALDQAVKNGLQRMDGNAKLLEASQKTVDDSIANMLKILQAQRNALKEQARSVEDQIEAIQKSPGLKSPEPKSPEPKSPEPKSPEPKASAQKSPGQ